MDVLTINLLSNRKTMSTIKTYTEYKLLTVLDKRFGRYLLSRMEKLDEEVQELFEALGNFYSGEKGLTTRETKLEYLRDEVADVYAVLTHIADILGMSQRDMIDRVMDKLKKRETDPEYKKQKQSVNLHK